MGLVLSVHRLPRLCLLAVVCLATIFFLSDGIPRPLRHGGSWRQPWGFGPPPGGFDWSKRPMKHPIENGEMAYLPEQPPRKLPRIQHNFSRDPAPDAHRKQELENRRRVVRSSFQKCWESYKEYAWGYDELLPESLAGVDTFAGWAATLVDSLDVLWIMGLEDEFREAADFVSTIDWDRSTADRCSVFETNIRYLGGLLAAHDLSGEALLLDKALELGHLLFSAFDTESHLPTNNLLFGKAKDEGGNLVPSSHESSANVGSLSLEFIRLTQLTGDPKFYTMVNRIKMELDRTQDMTKLPGMWPRYIDMLNGFMTPDNCFTLNAPADSLYEYLTKTYMILGGLDPAYQRMYQKAMETVRRYILFRPLVPGNPDILMSGRVLVDGKITPIPEVQHLGCFAGGMFALGGKVFHVDQYVDIGDRLARGCVWAYNTTATGIMPEQFNMLSCDSSSSPGATCAWDDDMDANWEAKQHKGYPKGISSIWDTRYILRPEAIESVFYLYRITGRRDLQDIAWHMFQSIRAAAETQFAFSAIADVTTTGRTTKLDSMESFWLAETLKYFYLIFSDPDVISLDDYVLNTEAHPLKIPKP